MGVLSLHTACRLLLAASLAGVAALGCNALFGIDDLVYEAGPAGTGGVGHGGSAGQPPGGSGGSGNAGGQGGGKLGPWGTPAAVTAINDPEADDDDPAFTADLLELYFNSERDSPDAANFWKSTRSGPNDPWGPPEAATALNSTESDTNLAIAPDGLTVWLSSNRDGQGHDIYVSSRPTRSSPWSQPVVVTELSSSDYDGPCAVTEDGLTIIIESNRDGVYGLYLSTRSSTAHVWDTPTAIAELNSQESTTEAWLSPEGLNVYLTSARDGPRADLYRSSRATLADAFAAPTSVDELNTSDAESDPWLSPDRRYIMFVRGTWPDRDIYEARR